MAIYIPTTMHLFRRYGRVRISPTIYSNPLSIDTREVIREKRKEKSRLAKKLNSNN